MIWQTFLRFISNPTFSPRKRLQIYHYYMQDRTRRMDMRIIEGHWRHVSRAYTSQA